MADEIVEIGSCCVRDCKREIYSTDSYFKCNKPECQATMCVNCMLDEETHTHPMVRVKGIIQEIVHFKHIDKKSGNTLFLGEYGTAIPGSKTIQKHNIKSVLSIMEFGDGFDGMKELKKAFYKDKIYNKVGFYKGVTYHHVAISDFRDPVNLSRTEYNLPNLLCETSTYIDERLKEGNVLVHCHLGQRRSPTMIVAWLCTRNFTPEKAIDHINIGYTSVKNWAKSYRKERPKWIAKLVLWKKKHLEMRKFWVKHNDELLQRWRDADGESKAELPEAEAEAKAEAESEAEDGADSESESEAQAEAENLIGKPDNLVDDISDPEDEVFGGASESQEGDEPSISFSEEDEESEEPTLQIEPQKEVAQDKDKDQAKKRKRAISSDEEEEKENKRQKI